jgi:DNA-binding CsgD family transcriptional regulator
VLDDYADLLTAAAEEALAGRARVLLVGGPCGGGAVLGEFATAVAGRFGEMVRFRCTPESAHRGLSAVRALFEFSADTSAETMRARLLHSLSERSLAVLVEDAHWCDEPSLLLFDALLRDAADRPFLAMFGRGSVGRSPADRALAGIAAQRRCRTLTVRGDAPSTVASSGQEVQSSHLRAVATAMAVLGAGDAGLVSLLSGVPRAKARAAIAELTPLNDGPALLAGLSRDQVVALRAKAARLLHDAARPATEIAGHLVALPRLGEPWMVDTVLEAAAAAERAGALATAVRYLARVTVARPGHLGARLALARALTALDPEMAMAELDEVVGLPAGPRARRTVVALFARAASVARPGDLGPVKAILARAGEKAEPAALAALSTNREAAAETLRARVGEGPEDPQGGLDHALRALSLAMRGRHPQIAASWARSLLRPDSPAGSLSLLSAATVLNLAADAPNSLRALDSAVADSITQGAPATIAQALATRSLALREYGDPCGADSDARAAALIAAPSSGDSGPALWRVALAAALYYAESPEAAERLLRRVPESEPERLLRLIWLARAKTVGGEVDDALRYLAECAKRHEASNFANPVLAPWWFESALILGGLGRSGAAADHVERGRDLVRGWPTPQARGLLLLAEATVAPDPVEPLREAGRVLATSFSRLEHARAEFLLGRAFLRREDRTAARRHLRQAALLATTSGWRALAATAREALGIAGGRMRRTVPQCANLLTEREREVAEMVAGGASNRDVAAALFVSSRTVELHLTNIYRKLAVTSRDRLLDALGKQRARTASDATTLGSWHGLAG